MPMTALQHHEYRFQRLVGTTIVSLNIKEHTFQAISALDKNWALGGGRRQEERVSSRYFESVFSHIIED